MSIVWGARVALKTSPPAARRGIVPLWGPQMTASELALADPDPVDEVDSRDTLAERLIEEIPIDLKSF